MWFSGPGGLKRKPTQLELMMHAPNFARLFLRLFNDKRVWFLPKLLLVLGVVYAVWPLDAVPGFPLVGVGYLDDVLVLYLAAKAFVRLCPQHVVQEHVKLIDQGG